VDIDAFVAANQASWWRLQELTRRARKPRSMSPDELAEMVALYQRCGAHLAHARVAYVADVALVNRLTLLVAESHGVLYGQRDTAVSSGLRTFATVTFPAAVWGIRRFVLVAFLLTAVPWAVMQIWLAVSPTAFDVVAPDGANSRYITDDFEDYYSNQPSQNFASQVFLNNIRVAFLAFAAGALLCVVTAAILAYNGAVGGVAGGMFTSVGLGGKFWGLILPHGLLELSAVIVAGAAGLRIGWTIIDPGDRRRGVALGEESRRVGAVLAGLVVAFLLAAIVEGFVTGRPWSTAVRVGIGIVVFLLFWGFTIAYAVTSERPVAGAQRRRRYSRPAAFSSR
jgi:uncharacterized membrane protein SpoIIM required for sporulation